MLVGLQCCLLYASHFRLCSECREIRYFSYQICRDDCPQCYLQVIIRFACLFTLMNCMGWCGIKVVVSN